MQNQAADKMHDKWQRLDKCNDMRDKWQQVNKCRTNLPVQSAGSLRSQSIGGQADREQHRQQAEV